MAFELATTMSAYIPSALWQWQSKGDVLALDTGVGSHSTAFQLHQLYTTPQQQPFTLEQAEAYWLYWHQLEQLGWPKEHCFAAAVDAVAGQFFLRLAAHKSWWFQPLSQQYQPTVGSLVQLAAQGMLLALVLNQTAHCAQLLLLQHGMTLQAKPLVPGQVLTVLCDRLQPHQQQLPPKLAKSA